MRLAIFILVAFAAAKKTAKLNKACAPHTKSMVVCQKGLSCLDSNGFPILDGSKGTCQKPLKAASLGSCGSGIQYTPVCPKNEKCASPGVPFNQTPKNGTCMPVVGRGKACDRTVGPLCASGLVCYNDDTKKCGYLTKSGLGKTCGRAGYQCKKGLKCVDNKCAIPTTDRLATPCASNDGLKANHTICAPQLQVCIKQNNANQTFACATASKKSCNPDDPLQPTICASGLICAKGNCVKSLNFQS